MDGGALGLCCDESGLCLRALGLWLDPIGPAPLAFVSHAHAASAASGSRQVLASSGTLRISEALGVSLERHRTATGDGSLDLPLGADFGGGWARISMAPAGHALGATQLVVDHPRGRLVYTGDWSHEADATHPAGSVLSCDELVVTSTFALPIFHFDPAARVLAALVAWCEEQLAAGRRAVVLAASPGPAQSIVAALSGRGLAAAAHPDIERACEAYRALGVPVAPARVGEGAERGEVLVSPTALRGAGPAGGAGAARQGGRRTGTAVAYASGWAVLDAAVEQRRADAAFPLPFQAGCADLLALARESGARRVYATRGDARALALLLRRRGIAADAYELGPNDPRSTS
jgi:putative mRNA 3-end processing factor